MVTWIYMLESYRRHCVVSQDFSQDRCGQPRVALGHAYSTNRPINARLLRNGHARLVGWTQFRSVALSASGLSPITDTQHSPRFPYAGIDGFP